MKFRGLVFNLILGIISIAFILIEIFLITFYGFDGQLLIALYILIGIVSLCSILSIILGFAPTIIIDDNCENIRTMGVYDERKTFKNGKKYYARFAYISIPFNEIIECKIDKKTILLKLKWNNEKTLFLSLFSKKQIKKIKIEIGKRIK